MTSRLLKLATLENLRDYGDYATAAGGRVRPGRLFRSGHHNRLDDADLERLGGLGLGTIVDLRRKVERTQQPSRRHAAFDGRVIESDLDAAGEAPHVTFLKTADLTADSGREFMTGLYRAMPFSPAHIETFGGYFRALADSDRPVLIHCAAGKDRTGLLAALTHHILGVRHDDLMEDYLLTNTAVDMVRIAPRIAANLKKTTGREPSHSALVAFLGVEAAYLDAAWSAITDRYGSIDAYLATVLGVDTAVRDRIGERLAA
ncbi:tyrosine-protein phosphatase [Brevundimonas sp.]|uniref:tyrosine-protein phosphatase n=1 Tax=Brevundimonas sp. TaxID=1871086 RepID=UPI001A227400|nr:tyrosine-protein phosphatase [Brevundimonas sp.]MBJ7486061.1 tyrosine-protein phosphatase [Brevundimonas sp.]